MNALTRSRQISLNVVAKAGGGNKPAKSSPKKVEYGNDWYAATREGAKRGRDAKQFYKDYREANKNERRDLYTANWDGDVYKGSSFNILNLLIVLSILVPVLGLIFARFTYGTLWG